jgi:hypothetical protein
MLHPPHFSWFDNLNNSWWQARIMKLLIRTLLHSHVTLSPLSPNIPLSSLFSNNLNLRPSLNVTKFHTYTEQQAKV